MASIPTLPRLSANATLEELINHVAILQKTMTFMMSSNLGTTNISEIGGWLLDEENITASNGTVGLSSAITGPNDVRIWAGDAASGAAPFRVHSDGSLYSSKATISGNITMTGGSIIWSGVNKPTYTPGEIGALGNSQLEVFNALTNNGLKRGLFMDQPTGELYINADYVNAGKIKAVNIDTVGLSAQKIYQSGFPNNYAVLGNFAGDLQLFYEGSEYFRIQNDLPGVSLVFKNNATTVPLLTYGHLAGTVKPRGTWDFSSASHNIVAKYG